MVQVDKDDAMQCKQWNYSVEENNEAYELSILSTALCYLVFDARRKRRMR